MPDPTPAARRAPRACSLQIPAASTARSPLGLHLPRATSSHRQLQSARAAGFTRGAIGGLAGRDRCASTGGCAMAALKQPGCSSGATPFAFQQAWQAAGLLWQAQGPAGAPLPTGAAAAAAC